MVLETVTDATHPCNNIHIKFTAITISDNYESRGKDTMATGK